MELADEKSRMYIDFAAENEDKDPNFEVGYYVRENIKI